MKLEFSRQMFEKYSKLYFMKICPAQAELFRSDGQMEGRTARQTDMTKLIVAFRNFATHFYRPHTHNIYFPSQITPISVVN
jgi:hypothetical protein